MKTLFLRPTLYPMPKHNQLPSLNVAKGIRKSQSYTNGPNQEQEATRSSYDEIVLDNTREYKQALAQ